MMVLYFIVEYQKQHYLIFLLERNEPYKLMLHFISYIIDKHLHQELMTVGIIY